MKKYMLITALCLVSSLDAASPELSNLNFTITPCEGMGLRLCALIDPQQRILFNEQMKKDFEQGKTLPYQFEPFQVDKNCKIGFIDFIKNFPKDGNTHISLIGIDPYFQRRGVGTALINAVENLSFCKTLSLNKKKLAPVEFFLSLNFICNSNGQCTKPCTQSSLPQPAQTSKLGSQESKSKGDVQ